MSTESRATGTIPKSENARAYSTDSVLSDDGTTIGYRQFGRGPGLILVHGGMMASHNFNKLAAALSDGFTVYVPDRRGRGFSGPFGEHYGMKKACEDLAALLRKTDAHLVFGLSAGALIVLQAALMQPAIQKIALYEPPLPLPGHPSPMAWVTRYDQELAQGNLGAAMVSVIKGTGDSSLLTALPRFLLAPLMSLAIRAEAKEAKNDDVPLQVLIPTMHSDSQIIKDMEGSLEHFRVLQAKVLLLGGSKSAESLKDALASLSLVLPHVQRIELAGLGHSAADNGGKPELVAQVLRRFFEETATADPDGGR
ncbi:MAG: alpha/beta hydrolase [Chloroflexota bacterium]|nr:alpha/beta hydrolase [Chloroflexota bacterium]